MFTNSIYSFQHEHFIKEIDNIIYCQKDLKKKPQKEIRHFFYTSWFRSLKAKKIGMTTKSHVIYGYPSAVLDYIRAKLPQNIKGEIKDTAYAL